MNILISGTTGFIGRHILYELLKNLIEYNINGKIYTVIRNKNNISGYKRLNKILKSDYKPDYLKKFTLKQMLSYVKVIDADLKDQKLAGKFNKKIKDNNFLYIIHAASITNLFKNKKSADEVFENNYKASLNLLKSLINYNYKFTYISTAYSCGIRDGIIINEYSKYGDFKFRNPYEYYKNKVEKEIIEFCKTNNKNYQILRPGAVCGRLIEPPFYFTSKFDVFYGWAKFFYRHKKNNKDSEIIRIQINKNSGINILPVDYVSKSIVSSIFDDEIYELNLVHEFNYKHVEFLGFLLEQIGYKSYEFVDSMPENKNRSEIFYYKTAGCVLTDYFCMPDYKFDTALLLDIMKNIKQPDIMEHMDKLIGFAIDNDFKDIYESETEKLIENSYSKPDGKPASKSCSHAENNSMEDNKLVNIIQQ